MRTTAFTPAPNAHAYVRCLQKQPFTCPTRSMPLSAHKRGDVARKYYCQSKGQDNVDFIPVDREPVVQNVPHNSQQIGNSELGRHVKSADQVGVRLNPQKMRMLARDIMQVIGTINAI